MRIVHVATDAAFQRQLGGAEHAARLVARARRARLRPARWPRAWSTDAAEILALDDGASAWDEALAVEPRPRRSCWQAEALDRALAAMGDFADLISPYLAGHSTGVAELAAAAAGAAGSTPRA